MMGDNIKALRQQRGYTQEELANKINVTRQTISKWEKNYSVPDATLLVRLAEIFDVPTSQLLGEVEEINFNNMDIYAQQLANIAEQMAIRNRRTKKVLKIIGIIVLVLVILFIGIIISSYSISVSSSEQEFFSTGSDGSFIIQYYDTESDSTVILDSITSENEEILSSYGLDSEVDLSLLGEQLDLDEEVDFTVYSITSVDDDKIVIVYNDDNGSYAYAIKTVLDYSE